MIPISIARPGNLLASPSERALDEFFKRLDVDADIGGSLVDGLRIDLANGSTELPAFVEALREGATDASVEDRG